MDIKEFNNEVIERFANEMTDLIFQYILEHDDLMSNYLDLISEKGRHTVNSQLGKSIKTRFNVENVDIDGNILKGNPNCVLIKTQYTKHKPKPKP